MRPRIISVVTTRCVSYYTNFALADRRLYDFLSNGKKIKYQHSRGDTVFSFVKYEIRNKKDRVFRYQGFR